MNFRSVADLNECLVRNIHRLPRDIDLIVGVPRSGLLAASMLALHMNLPLTDVEGFVAGRLFSSGISRRMANALQNPADARCALVLDDSILFGQQIKQTRALIDTSAAAKVKTLYAAVYATEESRKNLDFYFEICPMPRVFEWNILHHSALSNACVDIDGVLCRDPTEDENDDGPLYQTFLREAPPLFIPKVQVGYLVSCRLERYRKETEDWLARHNVKYRELILWDLPDKAARQRSGSHADYKAQVCRNKAADLFIESDPAQASRIAELTGVSVYCVSSRTMLEPSTAAVSRINIQNFRRQRYIAIRSSLSRKVRRILGLSQVS